MKEQPSPADVVFITNSPGELSSWVRVCAREVKAARPQARIVVMLVPCPYATGQEYRIACSYPFVDLVLPPWRFMAYLLGLSPRAYQPAPAGVVVFMGGDFWHALWLARKTSFRRLAYVVLPTTMTRHFQTVCVSTPQVKEQLVERGTPPDRIRVVGNLMVDGVMSPQAAASTPTPGEAGHPVLGLLPGSRLYHVRESLPAFLKVTEAVAAVYPQARFQLGLSPFISLEALGRSLESHYVPSIPGSGGRLQSAREPGSTKSGLPFIRTDAGVEVEVHEGRQYEVMCSSDLIITIPGTNTAEVACTGTPMVVCSTGGARVPRGGLGWVLGGLPLGRKLRTLSASQVLKRFRFSALPNQVAGRMLVPEVYVEKSADEVSGVVLELLGDQPRRGAMAARLRGLMGEPGAAARVKDQILALLEQG